MSKSFLITGATGLLGTHLSAKLLSYNHKVYILSTKPSQAHEKFTDAVKVVGWNNYLSLAEEKIDIIINLAGRNAGDKRWNDRFKKEIYESRILATKKIVDLISKMNTKPEVLINASGVDYYGSRGNENIYENAGPGDDFMARVCVDWEAEAKKAVEFGVRVVMMRTGFVLAKDAEAVKRLVLPFRLFAGGTIGSGKQFLSWIHVDDITGICIFAAENKNVTGPVNASAPHPEQMKIFCRNIAKVLRRPAIFPIPSFAVKLVGGEVGNLILSGRKALPKKIMELGYKFSFEYSLYALKDILSE